MFRGSRLASTKMPSPESQPSRPIGCGSQFCSSGMNWALLTMKFRIFLKRCLTLFNVRSGWTAPEFGPALGVPPPSVRPSTSSHINPIAVLTEVRCEKRVTKGHKVACELGQRRLGVTVIGPHWPWQLWSSLVPPCLVLLDLTTSLKQRPHQSALSIAPAASEERDFAAVRIRFPLPVRALRTLKPEASTPFDARPASGGCQVIMFLFRRACASRPLSAVLALLLVGLVHGQEGQFCNICGSGGVVGSPSQVIQEPILGTDTTCADLQEAASQNTYTSLQCTIIQFAVAAPCGCEILTSGGPVAAPSSAEIPTAPVTAPSSPSPPTTVVVVYSNVTTKVIIELSSVTGRMNPNVTAVYEKETCAYWASSSNVDVTNLKCDMLQQALSNLTDSSTGTRQLQDKPAIYLLATLLEVSARESSLESDQLGLELANTISDNPTAYVASLSLPFFETITDVAAFAASDAAPSASPDEPSPTEAPVASPNAVASPTDAPSEGEPSPTDSPTSAPIIMSSPTEDPSPSPVFRPTTKSPTTTVPLEPVAGLVSIQLEYVVGPMNDALAADFERQTDAYLTDALAGSNRQVSDVATKLRRQIAGSPLPPSDLKALWAIMDVTGRSRQAGDISQEVAEAINSNPTAYLKTLKSSDSAPIQIYLKSVENVTASPFQETEPPIAVPTMAPVPAPSSSSGLSAGAIAGIVIGLVVGVPLLLYVLYRIWGGQSKQAGLMPVGSNDTGPNTGGGGERSDQARVPTTSTPPFRSSSAGTGTAPVTAAAVPVRSSMRPSSRRMEEAPPSPPTKSSDGGDDEEEDDSMPGGLTGPAGTTSMAPTEDNGSYAYSMDAEEAIGPTATDGSTTDTSMAGGTSVGTPGGTTGAGSSTVSSDDVKTRKYKRIVVAPAGKLGIVIDTTLEGPVVYKVNEGSPLAGVIFPGDLIASIDDVETRAMSASNITTLMVQTAGQKRTLTLLSDDPNR